jgi:hypothetical protein
MKTIVHRSAAIVTFLGLLGLSLHAPQMSHLARFADLLVVAPRRKTLAQLAAQELDGVDPSNLADFFRISPWDPDDVRLPLIEFILTYLKRHHLFCLNRNRNLPSGELAAILSRRNIHATPASPLQS